MNLITHVLIGVYIQILCFIFFAFPFNFLLTLLIAFLSHFIVDAFSKITYHTPEPHWDDKFWLSWNIIVRVSGYIAIILFFPYYLGMLFANLPDIWDWVIVRRIQKRRNINGEIDYHHNNFFHRIVDKIREKTLFWLPNWIYEKKAVIPEILIDIALIIGIIFLMI
ncbi:MAG: hypothetical protein HWN81_18665 [Candidatus Lokiarchaeota archaeon]|nr:hypothetical protein [Candidatus Lokiarchaeota archaeon]